MAGSVFEKRLVAIWRMDGRCHQLDGLAISRKFPAYFLGKAGRHSPGSFAMLLVSDV